MKNLPTGTVTFLFTDIEGSTALLQQLKAAYAAVLMECRRLVRTAVQERGGQEVDTEGDAVFAAFPSAREALLAAVSAQLHILRHPWPDGATVRVRMGLHTGEATIAEGSYVGMDVHRAVRICAAAHGGQILLSETISALVRKDLPDGVSLRDLGEHRLKDLTHHHRLFQVVAFDLPVAFPPIRSLDALPNNLPRQLTSFIGREKEIVEVKRLLSAAYLVTLTGSGGAGKTRLALQVAADVVEAFPEGVWLAELAPITDPVLVPKTVASATNVPEQPGRGMTETLVDALRPKTLLLVLDNCEHLLAACRDLAAALLRRCPQVRILVTSREELGVPGEALWRVPSLSLPDTGHPVNAEDLMLYEAVRLFADRAVATNPRFSVTSENAPAVARVCQRLDGIPLAIELAAARINVLAVEQIADRLDDRFRLLTGGSPILLPRQQTLRAAIDWSYNLLTGPERVLLGRLAVFAGGWTLDAAETVCAGTPVKTGNVLDLLTSLVDKSLVSAETRQGDARYRLPETLRRYAHEKLAEAGDAAALRRRHTDWFLRMAEEAQTHVTGPATATWLRRLEREHDNFRAALEWITSEGRPEDWERGMRLAVALAPFWEIHSHFTEGRRWLEALIAGGVAAPPLSRAAALNAAGILAYRQGDHSRVSALCSEALALCEAHGDKRGAGRSLHFLAHLLQAQGDYAGATEAMERSIALHREAGGPAEMANSVDCLGEIARNAGEYDRAKVLAEEALALYNAIGHVRGRAHLIHNLGYLKLRDGDADRAKALFLESLGLARELGDLRDVVFAVVGLACASVDEADPTRGMRLLGAAETLLKAVEIRLEPAEDAEFRRAIEAARARVDSAAFAAGWAEGRAMTLDQAIEYALGDEVN